MKQNIQDQWLTQKDVVRYTGLSPSTIYRATKKWILKVSQRTGKNLFRREWVDKFLGAWRIYRNMSNGRTCMWKMYPDDNIWRIQTTSRNVYNKLKRRQTTMRRAWAINANLWIFEISYLEPNKAIEGLGRLTGPQFIISPLRRYMWLKTRPYCTKINEHSPQMAWQFIQIEISK